MSKKNKASSSNKKVISKKVVKKQAPKKSVKKTAKPNAKTVVKKTVQKVNTKPSKVAKKPTPVKKVAKKVVVKTKATPKKQVIKKSLVKLKKAVKKVVKVTPKKAAVKTKSKTKPAPKATKIAKKVVAQKAIVNTKISEKPKKVEKVKTEKPVKVKVEKTIKVKVEKVPKPVVKKQIVAPTTFRVDESASSSKMIKEPAGKFEMEFVIRASEDMVFEFVSTESGLSEWFCDDVNIRNGIFTFQWDGQSQQAKLVKEQPPHFIRYQWLDKNDGSYFEFRTQKDELTNDISLIITDFASDKDDEASARLLWHSQVDKLLHVLGSYF